jgi:hypothetical protein
MSNDPYQDLNDWLSGPDTCAPPDETPEAPDPDEDWYAQQERESKQAYANLKALLTSDERLKSLLSAHYATLGVHCGSQVRTPKP